MCVFMCVVFMRVRACVCECVYVCVCVCMCVSLFFLQENLRFFLRYHMYYFERKRSGLQHQASALVRSAAQLLHFLGTHWDGMRPHMRMHHLLSQRKIHSHTPKDTYTHSCSIHTYNKPPLKRGKVGSVFLMSETQKGIAAVPLLSGGLLYLATLFVQITEMRVLGKS